MRNLKIPTYSPKHGEMLLAQSEVKLLLSPYLGCSISSDFSVNIQHKIFVL
jgi:hypothetical protein